MARDFNGSSDYLSLVSGSIPATYPLSISCCFLPDNNTTTGTLVSIGSATTAMRQELIAAGATGGDPIQMLSDNNGSTASAASSSGFTAGIWNHAGGSVSGIANRNAYVNGGSKGNNTQSRSTTGLSRIHVGARWNGSTISTYYPGLISEVGVWDVVLSDYEFSLLGLGVSPSKIRPENLKFYAPLISPLVNLMGEPLTDGGATVVATHNRVFIPSRTKLTVANPTPSAPVYRGSLSGSSTSRTTGSFTPNAGDRLYAVGLENGTSVLTISDSEGLTWSEITTASNGAQRRTLWLSSPVSGSPMTVTITGPNGNFKVVYVASVSDSGSFITNVHNVFSGQGDPSTALPDTTPMADSGVLGFFLSTDGQGDPSIPSGFTEIDNRDFGVSTKVAMFWDGPINPTNAAAWTSTNSDASGILVEVRPPDTVRQASASVDGSLTLTAAAKIIKNAHATQDGSLTLTVASKITKQAHAIMSGSLTLAAAGKSIKQSHSILDGNLTLDAHGAIPLQASVVVSFQFDLIASGIIQKDSSVQFSSESDFDIGFAPAIKIGRGVFSGSLSLGVAAIGFFLGASVLSSESTLAATATKTIHASASLSGSLGLSVNGQKYKNAATNLNGDVTLVADGASQKSTSVSLAGSSNLQTYPNGVERGGAVFSATLSLSSDGRIRGYGAAALSGQSNFSIGLGEFTNAPFKRETRTRKIEINPYRPDIPPAINDLSPELGEYLAEQASILRAQHNITQAGDSTFTWEILTEVYEKQDFSLGSLGKFKHTELGLFLARFVKFTNWDSSLPAGSPCGRLQSPTENLWHVTNQLIYSSEDLVVGLAGPYDNDLEDKFGWVIVDGVNIQSVYADYDATEQQSVGWIGSGQIGVTKFRFGKLLPGTREEIENRGFHVHPVQFVVDSLAANTKDALIPDIDPTIPASIVELEGELNYYKSIINGKLSDLTQTINADTASVRRSIQIVQGRLFNIDPGKINAEIQDSIYLIANFANSASVAAANAADQAQFVTQTAYASNEFMRRAEIAKTDAGIFAESATSMANTATLMRNDSIVYADAAATSASSASASETAAGASASAASSSATNASTSASNANTSATQASTSATTASGYATTASAQATIAVAAASQAGLNAARGGQLAIRDTVADNPSWTTSDAGNETSGTALSSGSISTIPGNTRKYYSTGSSGFIFNRAIFDAHDGQVYDVEGEIYLSAANAGSKLAIRCVGLDVNYNAVSFVDLHFLIGNVTGVFVRAGKFGKTADSSAGITASPSNSSIRWLRFGVGWAQDVGGTAGGVMGLRVMTLGTIKPLFASVNVLAAANIDSSTGTAKAAFEVVAEAGLATAALRIKTETSPGTYTSSVALEASEIQLWNTSDSTRVLAAHIVGGRSTWTGDMHVGGMVRIGTRGIPVALQAFTLNASDGESISFGTDLARVPHVEFSETGLEPLAAGEVYELKAVSLTSTGFTMSAKILGGGSPGSISSGPGSNVGGTPSWQMHKTDAADSTNGYYTVSVTIQSTPQFVSGPFGGGFYIVLHGFDFYVRPGGTGSWILVDRVQVGDSAPNSSPVTKTITQAISYGGAIGSGAGTEFGVAPVYGTITAFPTVTYPGISGGSSSSATPNGQKVICTVQPQNIE